MEHSKSGGGKPQDARRVVDELNRGFSETAARMVDWFLKSMPSVYFQDTDHEQQLVHLRAAVACVASGRPIDIKLSSPDGSMLTYLRPMNFPGVLASMVKELPERMPLRTAKIHTSDDDKLVIVTFTFGQSPPFNPSDPAQSQKLEQTIAFAAREVPDWKPEEVRDYFKRCSAEHVTAVTPLRMSKQWRIFKNLSGTDGVFVNIEPEVGTNQSRILVAVSNAQHKSMLQRISKRLSLSKININRAHLDAVADIDGGEVTIQSFVVVGPDGGPIDPNSDLWQSVRRDLKRVRWLDTFTLDFSYRHDDSVTPARAELVMGLVDLAQQVLVKEDPNAFDRDHLFKAAETNLALTMKIVDLFEKRFNPDRPMNDADFAERAEALRREINIAVDADHRQIFNKLLDCVLAIRRTNFYVEDRYALSMRLDPQLLVGKDRENKPFGVYFVHGRGFNGFQVRFRDIARGGVRAVVTRGHDQHAREIRKLYDECYGLASAQQLKNKDIPEGGSKAVVIIEPSSILMRSVKAFGDAIIDLITPDPATKSRIVDYLKHDEHLFLGPDENITPAMIDWIVHRAKVRGYTAPTTLMSSKPAAGINHKVYGVTSEGITVFLDVALRHFNIDGKKKPFTIKITGGPDGDVAGNEIKILHREYGANARIVGIGDGTGVGEDPDGLNHQELLRLVEESRGIAEFDRKKLGPRGRIVAVDEPDGAKLRNTVHNRLVTDVFVPGGGRPNTIHKDNWRDFLTADGKPSSPIIVEGANLFLTDDAREELTKCGVFIVKDSSANKCGVICSSYEIIGCMLMNEEEFIGIKERYVPQVLDKLRLLARREAELLLRLYQSRPDIPLYKASKKISLAIIKASDAIEAGYDSLSASDKETMNQLIADHLPPILMETAGSRIPDRMPKAYMKWLMAKSLAARMVYREGLDWLGPDVTADGKAGGMTNEAITQLALKFLHGENDRARLVAEIGRSTLADKDRIGRLLSTSSILAGLSA